MLAIEIFRWANDLFAAVDLATFFHKRDVAEQDKRPPPSFRRPPKLGEAADSQELRRQVLTVELYTGLKYDDVKNVIGTVPWRAGDVDDLLKNPPSNDKGKQSAHDDISVVDLTSNVSSTSSSAQRNNPVASSSAQHNNPVLSSSTQRYSVTGTPSATSSDVPLAQIAQQRKYETRSQRPLAQASSSDDTDSDSSTDECDSSQGESSKTKGKKKQKAAKKKGKKKQGGSKKEKAGNADAQKKEQAGRTTKASQRAAEGVVEQELGEKVKTQQQAAARKQIMDRHLLPCSSCKMHQEECLCADAATRVPEVQALPSWQEDATTIKHASSNGLC